MQSISKIGINFIRSKKCLGIYNSISNSSRNRFYCTNSSNSNKDNKDKNNIDDIPEADIVDEKKYIIHKTTTTTTSSIQINNDEESVKIIKDQELENDSSVELKEQLLNYADGLEKSPINPFEYSIKTVDDALQLPDIKPINIESTYAVGAMHEKLKESMPFLKELVEKGHVENAFSLFQVMERYYVPVSTECYDLLRQKIEAAMVEVALFNEAIKLETINPGSVDPDRLYIPTRETLNTVLNYYTETDKLVEAFRLLLTMKTVGVMPNQHTYRSIINAALRYEDIDVALIAFENMRSDGIQLEEQSYERLFEACCNSVHYDGASDLYYELINNFHIPTSNRLAFLTTLGITRLMNWFGLPKSVRSGRGWVTSLQISPSRFIFPPKNENAKLLSPNVPKSILLKLTSSGGHNNNTNSLGGLLPFS
ncbi:hypothetical protein CYY_007678 [Polysphondylium violaceum]|uniref:Pentacotripeptide-repeat region of PRORP domain-containing protein n=1 Tax=Polysphondylium violaceum TaxID=133409 RepID=A0A8J4PQ24_9MYCE|nr:hypothetical protein CYY_007678 [Polysphondylium violaceum]